MTLLLKGNASQESLMLNEREAARFLGISPRTLWTLRTTGQIPFVGISPRCIRYSRLQLEAWVTAKAEARVASS